MLLTIVQSLLSSSLALSAFQDPHGLLSQANLYLQNPPFEQALKCGDQAQYDWQVESCEFHCENGACANICKHTLPNTVVTQTVSNCSESGVSIYGDNGYIMDLSKEDYEASAGNIAKIFLDTKVEELIMRPGYFYLTALQPTQFTLNAGEATERKMEAMNFIGNYVFTDKPMSVEVIVTFGRGYSSVGQVLRFRTGGSTWFRLKGATGL